MSTIIQTPRVSRDVFAHRTTVEVSVLAGETAYTVAVTFDPDESTHLADVTVEPEPPLEAMNRTLYDAWVRLWALQTAAEQRQDYQVAMLYSAAWALSDYRDDFLSAMAADHGTAPAPAPLAAVPA